MGRSILLLFCPWHWRFCSPESLLVSSLVHPSYPRWFVYANEFLAFFRRLLLVLGWAQVLGWPNQIEGKDLHLIMREEIPLFLLDLTTETAILLLDITVNYLMIRKETSLRMSLMVRTAEWKEGEYLSP